MSHNTFGHLFRVTTWGESHGPALGCVVDGCPPGIEFTLDDIQIFLDKRKPARTVPLASGDVRALLSQALRRDAVALDPAPSTPRFRPAQTCP